jgi:glycerophosphoryl diester phosphodiesterase
MEITWERINQDIPIENTKEAVRKAFQDGISVVEIDVVLSKDGKAVANHDDYYSQTCLHDLDCGEIQELLPHPVALLEHILQVASVLAKNSDTTSGLVVVEIKNSSPLCDPEDEQGPVLAQAVVDTIKKAGMEDQVLIQSFGPDLLLLAQKLAPEIPRSLIVNALQLLTQEQVEAITGLSVIAIDKDVLGLTWAETGPFFRLPAYVSGVEDFLRVAITLGVVCVNLDKLFFQNPDVPAGFVQII